VRCRVSCNLTRGTGLPEAIEKSGGGGAERPLEGEAQGEPTEGNTGDEDRHGDKKHKDDETEPEPEPDQFELEH